VDVLGVLGLEDLHGIVDGDQTGQTVLRVDHRQCHEVGLLHQPSRYLTVLVHTDRVRVETDELADRRADRSSDQVGKVDDSDESAPVIGDRHDVHLTGTQPRRAHSAQRIRRRLVDPDIGIPWVHCPSGRCPRVAQEQVRVEASLVGQGDQHPIGHRRRHLLQQPRPVVSVEAEEELVDRIVCQGIQQLLLVEGVERLEHGQHPAVGQQTKHHGPIDEREADQLLGDVHGAVLRQPRVDRLEVTDTNQLVERGRVVGHEPS